MSVNLSDAQFEALLARLSPGRHGSFASCNAQYDGVKNPEVVEAFLAATSVFKELENISDSEALTGVPLVLKGEAAVWWQGVKQQVTTWEDFKERLCYAFAPKKPAYVIYQEIVQVTQDFAMPTENFIAHKRMLLSQLPGPAHTEAQQLDMVYGQLKHRMQEKIPRHSITTFDELLKAARAIEQLWSSRTKEGDPATFKKKTRQSQVKCGFCHFPGHSTERCRKFKKEEKESELDPGPRALVTRTQAPSPSTPRVSCYGCGAPGVVRTSCPTCSTKKRESTKTEVVGLSFCPIDLQFDVPISVPPFRLSPTKKEILKQEQEDAYSTLKICSSKALYCNRQMKQTQALGAVLVQGEKDEEHPLEYASSLLITRLSTETKPYTLKTDASSYALRAVPVQRDQEDELPVKYAYESHKTGSPQKGYCCRQAFTWIQERTWTSS